ncbi:hypothetical protein GW17_00048740 [Ensete ventricosum]|nr:hypothetical protein GW17_00048740 [Ensete ventricosum]
MVASEKATLWIAALSPATSSCSSSLGRGRRGSAAVAPPTALSSLRFANANVQMSTRLDIALSLSLVSPMLCRRWRKQAIYRSGPRAHRREDERMRSRRSPTASVIQGIRSTQEHYMNAEPAMGDGKLLISFLALSLFFALCPPSTVSRDAVRDRYEGWIARHGRTYKDKKEREQRFKIYHSNLLKISKFNAEDHGYKLTDNRFADMTNEEFRAKHMCLTDEARTPHPPPVKVIDCIAGRQSMLWMLSVINSIYLSSQVETMDISSSNSSHSMKGHIPEQLDWRKKGAVTGVTNQGPCGKHQDMQ